MGVPYDADRLQDGSKCGLTPTDKGSVLRKVRAQIGNAYGLPDTNIDGMNSGVEHQPILLL